MDDVIDGWGVQNSEMGKGEEWLSAEARDRWVEYARTRNSLRGVVYGAALRVQERTKDQSLWSSEPHATLMLRAGRC